MKETRRPAIEIIPASTWADQVAERLADRVASRARLVVCLPTGSTPRPVYERLPEVLRARGIDLALATIVLLDEYLGLPPGHPARCEAMLRAGLLDRLAPPVGRFVAFDVDGRTPDVAAASYDTAIESVGGLDLVLLGLGANGHIGMNEPGSPTDSGTRSVALAETTREAAAGYGADPVPTHGITLGLAGIRTAAEVWLLATGEGKADILARTLASYADGSSIPAASLLDHPGLRIIVDDAAAGARS